MVKPGFPALRLVRTYDRAWIRPDALAAVTVWALLVPQALAYAQLAQVDAVVGLYAAMGAAVGYFLLGGVRSMNVGPEATVALLTASVIAPMAEGDPSRYLALAGGLALMTGLWMLLAGVPRGRPAFFQPFRMCFPWKTLPGSSTRSPSKPLTML